MPTNNSMQEISTVQLIATIKGKLARRNMRLLSTSYPQLSPSNSITERVKQYNSATDYSSYNPPKQKPRSPNRYSYLDSIKTSEEAWRGFQQNKNSRNNSFNFDLARSIDTPPASPPKTSSPPSYTGHYLEYLRKRQINDDDNINQFRRDLTEPKCSSFIPISRERSEEKIWSNSSPSSKSGERSKVKSARTTHTHYSNDKKLRRECQQEIDELQQMIKEIKQKVANIYNPESALFRKLSQCERKYSKNARKRAATTGGCGNRKERVPKTISA